MRLSLTFACFILFMSFAVNAFAADVDYLAQAKSILNYYLADNTSDVQFRRSLAHDQAEQALALAEKHIALHADDPLGHAWAALALDCLGQPEDANAEIAEALEDGLTGSAWLDLAGDIQFERGDFSSALDYYSRAAEMRKNPWHQWDLARTLEAIGDSGAHAAWDKLTADYPQSQSAWLEHGWHAYEQKDYTTAQADYEHAIALKDTAEAHNRLAIMLGAKGDAAGAEAEYQKAIALEATPQLYANLIDLMTSRNASDAELAPVFEQLLAKFPDDPYAQRINGDRLLAAGNPQAALAAYQRAGQDAYTLNAIGNCLFKLQRYDEAAQNYDASLKQAYDPTVLGNLAGALRAAGKKDDERALWEKHVALHGDDGAVREGYANALFNTGDFAKALEQYQLATRSGADDANLHNQTGLTLLQLGRNAEAAGEFKSAAAQDAQPIYFGNAGYALGLAGQWDEAEAVYRAGLAKFPNDAELTSGLGEALAAQGHSAQAAAEVMGAAEAGGQPVGAPPAASAVRAEPASPATVDQPIMRPATPASPPAVSPEQPAVQQDNIDVVSNTADSAGAVQTAGGAGSAPTEAPAIAAPPPPDPSTQARLFAEAAHHAADAGNVEQALQAYQSSFAAKADLDVAADWALLLAANNRGEPLVKLVGDVRAALGADGADKLVDRLGRYYLEKKDYAGGSDFMQRLIAADPRAAMPYNQLALMQASQQHTEDALLTVKRGLNDAGDNYIGRYLEASFTATVSGPEAALPLAYEVTQLPGIERNGYLLYLKLLDTQGNYGEAAQVARKALAQNPGNAPIFGHLARALYFGGDVQGAIALLEDPANVKLDYPARYEILGQSYLDLGNYVKAAGYLNQALALRPDSADLLAALGEAQHFLGKDDDARTTLGKALNLDPQLPAAHLWQGWVQASAGDSDSALANFAAVEGNPLSEKDELAWAALGRANVALAQRDRTTAQVQSDKAATFNVRSDAFGAELDKLRAQL